MRNSLVHLKVPVPGLLVSIFLWLIFGANVAPAAQMSKAAVNEGADAIVADSLADAVRTTVGEQAKLRPSDGAAGDYFGYSVSLSGNRALVGAVGDSDNGLESGAAYVFAFDGTTWNEQAKLTASDEETGDSFGTAVALLGTRALVGAIHNDSDGIGAAYFFDSNGTTWTERAKFSAADSTTGDYFGISVSLSGPRALVGANQGGLISGPPGTAYVFGR